MMRDDGNTLHSCLINSCCVIKVDDINLNSMFFSHFSSELLWRSSIYEYGILIPILYFIVFIIGIRSHTLAHCSSMIAVFLNGWSWHGVFLVRGWDLYGPWPCYCSGILQVLGRHLILSALLVILIFKLAPSSFIVFGIVYRRTRMSKWTRRLLLFISFFSSPIPSPPVSDFFFCFLYLIIMS